MPNPAPSIDEIRALETQYWEGMKAKDGAATARLSGDPSLTTGPMGIMSIPRAKMGEMTECGDWTLKDYAFEDFKVESPIPDVAIAVYVVKQSVTIGGEDKSFRAADSSTWVRTTDGWTCCAHSETILDDKPKA